jgi:hypothetical protein
MGGGEPQSLKTFHHQEYFDLVAQNADLAATAPYDVALVLFPEGTATRLGVAKMRELVAAAPLRGDLVRLLGFGYNDMVDETGAGTKRDGTNRVVELDDEFIVLHGTSRAGLGNGFGANVGSGDSGGPLLTMDGKVAGVAVAVGPIENEQHYGFYVNVSGPLTRTLFERAVHCSTPPCAPDFLGSGTVPDPDRPPVTIPPPQTSPNGTCRFAYDFEQAFTNGPNVTYYCHARVVASACAAGHRCRAPGAIQAQCPEAPGNATDLACR